MSRAPPPGGPGRMPYGGLPGSNPRAAMGQSPPSGGDAYGQYGDARGSPAAGPRSPGMQRYGEKGPPPPPGGGRPVSLRVGKVSDRSLQARLIYGNL